MSAFTVRIELHSGIYHPDFDTLHRAMEVRGFSKFINSDQGVSYHLPRAEYVISTINDINWVLELAKAALNETGKTGEIFITEAKRWMWFGLTQK